MEDTIKTSAQDKVYIRYIVNDVKESVDFYTQFLGFNVKMQPPETALPCSNQATFICS